MADKMVKYNCMLGYKLRYKYIYSALIWRQNRTEDGKYSWKIKKIKLLHRDRIVSSQSAPSLVIFIWKGVEV